MVWGAVIIYFVLFVYACVMVHRLRMARRGPTGALRRAQVGDEVRRILSEKETSELNYRYM